MKTILKSILILTMLIGSGAQASYVATPYSAADGGTGATTFQGAMNNLAGAVTAGDFLRGDGTNVVMSTIQSADIPNNAANTTGTAANITATSNTTLTTLNSLTTATSLDSVGTISSGTWQGTDIAVGFGGTGLGSTPTNGQLLIGNGSGYTLTTITQGSGITVTNGSGTITIAATSVPLTVVDSGNAAFAITSADTYVRDTTTLTANRTWTLPACTAGNIGEYHLLKNQPAQTFNAIIAAGRLWS